MKRIYSSSLSLLVALSFTLTVCAQSPAPPIVIQTQAAHKDFVDYLVAGVQIATLIALVIYVAKTWQIAGATQKSAQLSEDILTEMRVTRIQEIAPYVIVYFDMPYSSDWVMYLVVKNTGQTVAKDIKFKFEPPLVTGFTRAGEGTRPFDIYLLREGISLLAPDQEIRTPFDAHSTYLQEKLPTVYKVEVSYTDGRQPNRTVTEQILDVSIFNDLSVLQKKGEEDLIKALETIAGSNKELQRQATKIANSLLSGIWINNPEMLSTIEVHSREAWMTTVTGKLVEICSIWKNVHGGNFDRPFRLSADELKSRLGIFASHLLLITSHSHPSIAQETKQTLLEIVTDLYKLSKAPFYMDGGKSAQEFNLSGDAVVEMAEGIIKILTNDDSSNEQGLGMIQDPIDDVSGLPTNDVDG